MFQEVRSDLEEQLDVALSEIDLNDIDHSLDVNTHPSEERGDLSTPLAFQAAQIAERAPNEISEELSAQEFNHPLLDSVSADGPYVNFHLDEPHFAKHTVDHIQESREEYGSGDSDRLIVEDVSSPNIAKPLHIGHLRNTVMGDALSNVLEHRGNEVIKDNHLGDWGGQFGNLMYAFDQWGNKNKLEEQPIEHLLELYQKVGQKEAELQDQGSEEELEALRGKGREWFSRLEEGDERATELWEKFRDVSIERFEETYNRLGVEFDEWIGESFYVMNGWTDEIVEEALEDGVARKGDNGSVIIDLEPNHGEDSNEFVILTSEGTTLYPTRDLAAIDFREEEFGQDEALYVVASEQDEYFQDLFEAAGLMGYDSDSLEHISYGMISLPEGSMSTRRGQIITAREVLDETYEKALDIVNENNPELENDVAAEIAEEIALGAVKYENVKVSRDKNITFDMDQATSFNENSGPYIQYAARRAESILEDADDLASMPDHPVLDENDTQLARSLAVYPLALERAEESYDPAPVAHYLFDLSQDFNSFYHENRVLGSETEKERLALTDATHEVLNNGLGVLGINTVDKM